MGDHLSFLHQKYSALVQFCNLSAEILTGWNSTCLMSWLYQESFISGAFLKLCRGSAVQRQTVAQQVHKPLPPRPKPLPDPWHEGFKFFTHSWRGWQIAILKGWWMSYVLFVQQLRTAKLRIVPFVVIRLPICYSWFQSLLYSSFNASLKWTRVSQTVWTRGIALLLKDARSDLGLQRQYIMSPLGLINECRRSKAKWPSDTFCRPQFYFSNRSSFWG